MQEAATVQFPEPPAPTQRDLRTFTALRQYYSRTMGFTYPEAELRQQRSVTSDGRVGPPRSFPGFAALQSGKQFAQIPVPALVITSTQDPGRWADNDTDPAKKRQLAVVRSFIERQAQAIEDGVPTAHVVRLSRAHHYVFLSNEADVLREMRAFLGRR
jgi:pimeloyl-ACP methyl ester carboxylesterase